MSELKTNVRLKRIREYLQYTQEQFAEIMEMSLSGYKKLESGEIKLGIDKLHILHEKFGLSADFILYDEKSEFNAVWENILNLSEEEKRRVFLRLHAYLARNIKDDRLIDQAIEVVDKAGKKFWNEKCNGE